MEIIIFILGLITGVLLTYWLLKQQAPKSQDEAIAYRQALVQSIVQLAKSFRMSITAEGVETAEDFERMRDLGCDTIQGYLFGRPLSYERANQMVQGLGAKRMAG